MILTLSWTLLALLALCTAAPANQDAPAVTTAPIYLPYYNKESWSVVRGSIISSNPEAQETTYTIFCPDATDSNPPACDLSLEFPFVLIEGPDTIQFHGTHTSTLTANLECTLHGKTRATCSGYSSFADGYDNGVNEGPTEVTWTSTFSGSQMEWGVLTMAELPHDPDSFTATWATPTAGSEFVSVPMATESDSDSAGASRRIDMCRAVFAVVCVAGWLW
ncbi:hypothetical protein BHE90_002613 [Fusarium euwallaceae]|uniref:Ubiquitin 3 binding protein But2 C-terminal domain-containing protein n=1 Tax=Fusarium euwallaceae TaxID=1147111 RepID=A0A430M4C3_9HYPO|nr:hypothetical protein BHE90_002613 [Fusarium euwallaceae]